MRVETDHVQNINPNRNKGFWRGIILGKFSAPLVIGFALILSLLLVFSMSGGNLIPSVLFIVAMVGIITVCGVVAYPRFGIIVLFLGAYLLFVPLKFPIDFPLGTLMDLLVYLLILGFFFSQKVKRDWKIFADPLSILILAWILYNLAQVANPASISGQAWMYTIRSIAGILLTYYIFVFQIRETSFIKLIFKLWICLAFIAACDGFKQEVFGFFDFEKTWLFSDPGRVELYFQGGHMRKFSIMADPVAFGYNMASAATLCLALAFGPIKTYQKVVLVILACFFLFTMLFSGTRGAFPLVPAALALFAVLNYNKRVLIFSLVVGVLFVFMIFVPTSNQNILRFQTAFRPNEDQSYKARKINQARIRPYIRSHPIGGGLGATGVWGQRFAPGSFLASFPPDSGYVRVAVETGIIGLIMICTLIFVALLTGINNFYLIKDPELKNYCMAVTMVIFAYNVGNYPQEAIAQYPSSVIFVLCIALTRVTKILDDKKQLQLAAQTDEGQSN
ncbi:MAG: O-antigen ligase family protein [Mucilaginibacter sp.]|uniref:O-antigen ligase family protein n=1 Tax=Mucilaginibacter sp. TaxID=1882438 RepID=UPI003263B616